MPDSPDVRRRSVYMFHKRLLPYPLLQAFDRPDLLVSCSIRQNTTVAPQALALMNDPTARQSYVAKKLNCSLASNPMTWLIGYNRKQPKWSTLFMLEPTTRDSSQVTIMLLVAGLELGVAQVTNSLLFLRETADVEPGKEAELIIQIDGKLVRELVILPSGIRTGDREISYF